MVNKRKAVCEPRNEAGVRPILIDKDSYIWELRILGSAHANIRLPVACDAI